MRLKLALGCLVSVTLVCAAHADVIDYKVVTSNSSVGHVSGTISGFDTTVTAFDLIVQSDSRAYYLNSSDRGFESSIPDLETTVSGAPVSILRFFPGSFSYFLDIEVTGDFQSGLSYVGGQNAYQDGQLMGTFERADLLDRSRHVLTIDDVALIPEFSAVTPEPSALVLFTTGLCAAALCATARSFRRRSSRLS